MKEGAKTLSKSEVTLRPFVVLTALLAVCLAHAGRYELSIGPSGGAVTLSPGPPTYVAYTPAGTSTSVNTGGGGTPGFADAKGVITTTFVWVPEFENDEPPPQVVVYENSSVHYHAKSYPSGVSGSCSNGLGHTATNNIDPITIPIPVPPYTTIIGYAGGGNCAGERAQIVAGGERIIVRCEPKVRVDVASGPIENVRVNYSVGVAWPEIQFAGTVFVNDIDRIMVGQKLKPNVTMSATDPVLATRFSLATKEWSPTGSTFYWWWPSTPSDWEGISAWRLAGEDAAWRYSPSGIHPTTESVGVSAQVLWGPVPLGPISSRRPLEAWPPYWYFAGATGHGPSWVFKGQLYGHKLWLVYDETTYPGVKFESAMGTPPWCSNTQGFGSGTFTQLLAGSRAVLNSSGWHERRNTNGRFDLDNSFVYGSFERRDPKGEKVLTPFPADSTESEFHEYYTNDSPGICEPGFLGAREQLEFAMYALFQPPPNGDTPNFVTLGECLWDWHGDDIYPNLSSLRTLSPAENSYLHIHWTQVQLNTTPD